LGTSAVPVFDYAFADHAFFSANSAYCVHVSVRWLFLRRAEAAADGHQAFTTNLLWLMVFAKSAPVIWVELCQVLPAG
jgi:hypothetical protein